MQKNFGVPQKRERAYMISILMKNPQDALTFMRLISYFDENNLEDTDVSSRIKSREFKLKDVLRLNYDIPKYREEADINQPNNTLSRQKILRENDMLIDGKR